MSMPAETEDLDRAIAIFRAGIAAATEEGIGAARLERAEIGGNSSVSPTSAESLLLMR